MSSVLLGARALEQLDDNLGAADLHLSAEETTQLEEASTPIVDDHPYGELGVSQRDRGLPAPRSSRPNLALPIDVFGHDRLDGPAPTAAGAGQARQVAAGVITGRHHATVSGLAGSSRRLGRPDHAAGAS